jgi:two-component system chemotaxis sensor kinase CheA
MAAKKAPASAAAKRRSPTDAEGVRRINGTRCDADHWHISVRFGPDVLRNGMDPLSFIRYLGTMGEVTGMATVDRRPARAGQMDPELCYLGFEIAFQSNADKAAIERCLNSCVTTAAW